MQFPWESSGILRRRFLSHTDVEHQYSGPVSSNMASWELTKQNTHFNGKIWTNGLTNGGIVHSREGNRKFACEVFQKGDFPPIPTDQHLLRFIRTDQMGMIWSLIGSMTNFDGQLKDGAPGASKTPKNIPVPIISLHHSIGYTSGVNFLVGGLEHGFHDFPYIGNVIIPTDFSIFRRGRSTTKQFQFGKDIYLLLTFPAL